MQYREIRQAYGSLLCNRNENLLEDHARPRLQVFGKGDCERLAPGYPDQRAAFPFAFDVSACRIGPGPISLSEHQRHRKWATVLPRTVGHQNEDVAWIVAATGAVPTLVRYVSRLFSSGLQASRRKEPQLRSHKSGDHIQAEIVIGIRQQWCRPDPLIDVDANADVGPFGEGKSLAIHIALGRDGMRLNGGSR